ncbi:histidinol dehydrogenase [Pseudoalteromonas sp. MEBiC 03607]|jgi:histidinol dehydrogenase|uniref:histidinol dehydrogenase n=1 Tax=Pseudoalteromonas TaxID=53246 RepID=UPI000EBCD338|nr:MULTISPECIES: histidinol dehydrogenase [unclassified Pseudoalteromonas]MCF2920015.1 histidinol dehydrogenase [Pseudoalteromonas sp. APAL1]MCO7250429.1 histidinol dehydrogenase [Pseudoalteromonas sp. Ps84H-4]TGV17027.1 histidinol dehydrogenase [Pseudoalteromonas sp. MEBiC 03607]HCV02780.1 histidinol dehydrogenase [Pseudoalteromonas sp.]
MFRWNEENQQAQQAVLTRPAVTASKEVEAICIDILNAVKTEGDAALLKMAKEFDKRETPRLLVPVEEINQAEQLLSNELKAAIETAYANVKRFHQAQLPKDIKLTTQPGVLCELKYQAIEAVGIYVPGGSAPLPSSVIMQGVLAQLSGAQTVVLTTPVKADETINPAILYAAKLCGIKTIVESGGAGAIAAMAYGTESVPKVNKIFGPGNSFVTMAKQLVAQTIPGMAIDMPAGPSEVLVIADERANPEFIAADLLSQAEHGADSQVILLCNSERIIEKTQQALTEQLAKLSRKDTAEQALANSSLILVDSVEQAFAVSAQYGPEHLILQLADAQPYLNLVKNAGSVFVGDYTPESAGDYASGTNHVLPTYGYSATYSSLNLLDFFRTYTVQTISKNGLRELSKAILPLAAAEGLDAHANAVSIRLEAMNNER